MFTRSKNLDKELLAAKIMLGAGEMVFLMGKIHQLATQHQSISHEDIYMQVTLHRLSSLDLHTHEYNTHTTTTIREKEAMNLREIQHIGGAVRRKGKGGIGAAEVYAQ